MSANTMTIEDATRGLFASVPAKSQEALLGQLAGDFASGVVGAALERATAVASRETAPPPADEPMTIENLLAKWWKENHACEWEAVKADLTALAQAAAKAQARRDAATCLEQQQISRGSLHDSACRDCHNAILRVNTNTGETT